MDVVHTKYLSRGLEICKAIQDCEAVSFTTDIWTSLQMEVYLTVTSHFITGEWRPESFVLEAKKWRTVKQPITWHENWRRSFASGTFQVPTSFLWCMTSSKHGCVHQPVGPAALLGKYERGALCRPHITTLHKQRSEAGPHLPHYCCCKALGFSCMCLLPHWLSNVHVHVTARHEPWALQ